MDPTIEINERVSVAVVYNLGQPENASVMPVKMHWKQRQITFTKLGLRHPTAQGKRMIHVFDVSDGVNDYRLEHDAERLTWTLVYVLPGDASHA